ncbi:MAG: nucleotidyltransferase domain-containing protein [Tepidiformaceae bacterium]
MTSHDEAVALAARIAARLVAIEGVAAVALGGSRARGTAAAGSDVDLGVFYHARHPPRVEALAALAAELDDERRLGLATGFGEWGPWVNGGAWLQVDGIAVDWLYREIGRVTDVIESCRRGEVTCDYYLGHPHGFHNHIYLGEVHYSLPLADPGNALSALKVLVAHYPSEMRARIVSQYLYDARFMLEAGRKSAARGDVMHAAGCLFRVVAALVQVLYALNQRYFVNEKESVAEIERMAMRPPRWTATVSSLLGAPGTTAERLSRSVVRAERLVGAVEELARREGLGMTGRLPGAAGT